MKQVLFGMILSFFCATAGAQKIVQRDISEQYLQQNIAFTKTAARAVTSSTYATEITLTDFAKISPLPTGFGFQGLVFADDGKGYDKIRGDGVYSSKSLSKFKNGYAAYKESNQVAYDESFSYKDQIDKDGGLENKVKISCKFKKCGCPCTSGGTCIACTQWGWSCWEIVECEISFELF
ncbi:MAG: hypothetical protein WEA59_07450 [Ferruginibacter sp.]